MSLRTFDPDGGDLGVPDPIIQGIPLQDVILKAAKLLTLSQALSDVSGLEHRFCYGIRLPSNMDGKDFDTTVRQLTLPSDVQWYSIDGKKIFELRGASGGVVSAKVAYLITYKRN